jgi:transcriptional repressor OPI1
VMEQDHMQMPERPPSYTQTHDPQTINLPSAPKTDFAQIHNERTLPPLPSAPLEPFYRPTESTDLKYQSPTWPSSNPLTAYYQPTTSQSSPTSRSAIAIDSPGAMEVDIGTPDSRGRRGGSVLSIDDPDVRIAAEALGDLRAGNILMDGISEVYSLIR